MTPEERLEHQLDTYNACVETGDFSPYSELFAPQGAMKLVGGAEDAQGRYVGRADIRDVCAVVFTDRAMRLLSIISAKQEAATVDYAWQAEPREIAGQMIVKWNEELISNMTVIFT